MPGTAVDTSVIVASLLGWHEHHEVALRLLNEAISSEGVVLLPVQALLESYAVLTRLPPPHRLSPRDALQLLEASLQSQTRLISTDGQTLWDHLSTLAETGVAGGATYDAHILQCAHHVGADRILTLNTRDFTRLKPMGLELVTPDRT